MGVLNKLLKDSKLIPQTFRYKLNNNTNLLTIEDQQEALTDSYWSYCFAKANVPGSDFKALQVKACEDPECAYYFAKFILGVDIKYCQQHACKDPSYAYLFARNISGADIKYCQEHACKDSKFAYCFARDINGADKEYCRQVCKGTQWEF